MRGSREHLTLSLKSQTASRMLGQKATTVAGASLTKVDSDAVDVQI
jgi:hypothetical protein